MRRSPTSLLVTATVLAAASLVACHLVSGVGELQFVDTGAPYGGGTASSTTTSSSSSTTSSSTSEVAGSGGTAGTGGIGGSGGGGTGGAGGSAPTGICQQAGLALCYELEGNVLDGTSAHNDATATAVSYVGGVAGQAISLDANSVVVPPTEAIALSELTIELWIYPTALPAAGARMGILDQDGRFGLFLYSGGELRCAGNGGSASAWNLQASRWTHVACAIGNAEVRVYVDGSLAQSATSQALDPSASVARIGSNSPSGDPFLGHFDSIRVFDVVRMDAEICAAAGGAGC